MNMYPALTNPRSHLSDQFSQLQSRAVRASLWAKLTGKSTKLDVFPEQSPEKSPNRRLLGEQEIPVDQIVGTLSRHADFDHKFRPVRASLRDRWINVYLALQNGGCPPILVHKVGENYYVEDGHHRVSVTRLLGLAFIQAKVWEYPVTAKSPQKCEPAPCIERRSRKTYATAYYLGDMQEKKAC